MRCRLGHDRTMRGGSGEGGWETGGGDVRRGRGGREMDGVSLRQGGGDVGIGVEMYSVDISERRAYAGLYMGDGWCLKRECCTRREWCGWRVEHVEVALCIGGRVMRSGASGGGVGGEYSGTSVRDEDGGVSDLGRDERCVIEQCGDLAEWSEGTHGECSGVSGGEDGYMSALEMAVGVWRGWGGRERERER
ncbi:hypothetical protein Tco_0708275 [Tanacetum coccineum]